MRSSSSMFYRSMQETTNSNVIRCYGLVFHKIGEGVAQMFNSRVTSGIHVRISVVLVAQPAPYMS